MNVLRLTIVCCLLLVIVSPLSAATLKIDFEELPLGPDDFYNGSSGDPNDTGFTSHGVYFNNDYLTQFDSWQGWAYSSETSDPNTPGGVGSQYKAYPGSGANGSVKFGVAFSGHDAGGGIIPEITLPSGAEPTSVKVTNTTYAALSMLQGDGFAKQFGGPSGSDPDWFLLRVEGKDATDTVVGDVSLYLADYRPADPNDDYILDQWTDLDLTPLAGMGVSKLAFRLSSSDPVSGLMNTPAYVAIDDLVLDIAATPGDFDLNGSIDQVDLGIWEQYYGTASGASVTTGDADDDGDVDGADLLLWQTNYTGTQAITLAVPEPSSVLILLGCLAVVLGSSRFSSLLTTPCS
jgi:hypothetical protein